MVKDKASIYAFLLICHKTPACRCEPFIRHAPHSVVIYSANLVFPKDISKECRKLISVKKKIPVECNCLQNGNSLAGYHRGKSSDFSDSYSITQPSMVRVLGEMFTPTLTMRLVFRLLWNGRVYSFSLIWDKACSGVPPYLNSMM